MVIRPVLHGEGEKSETQPVSAWQAVEETQHAKAADYWLIPQPAHAALTEIKHRAHREHRDRESKTIFRRLNTEHTEIVNQERSMVFSVSSVISVLTV